MPVAAGKKCSPYNFRFIQDDPLKIIRVLWPATKFSREQEQILYSVWYNFETDVKAANMMGKDYIASFAIVAGFVTRWPCRIVTTSADSRHLVVLWAEIHNRINSSRIPLRVEQGGPLTVLQQELWSCYEMNPKNPRDPGSYVISLVADDNNVAKMGGHHLPEDPKWLWRNMFVGDEASGLEDNRIEVAKGWCQRLFLFGNTWECSNYFRRAFEGRPGTDEAGGDVPRPNGKGYIRRVFSLPVEASPNIRLARAQLEAGKEPTGEIIVPGIKSWAKYQEELADPSWDEEQRCIKHRAEWYKGKAIRLFPQEWLDRALGIGRELEDSPRKAKAMGVDPAEGGDKTAICVIDEYGIIELWSDKTEDTASVQDKVVEFVLKYNVPHSKVYFDSGGGGKQHVDNLLRQGYKFHAVSFGEGVTSEPKRMKRFFDEIVDLKEEKGAYLNRRAEMYGEAAILFDPYKRAESNADEYDERGQLYRKGYPTVRGIQAFGIPPKGLQYGELVRQLSAIPKKYVEGKLYIPPKSRRGAGNTGEKTLTEILGRSPDEADAFVLAVYAMTGKRTPFVLKGYS